MKRLVLLVGAALALVVPAAARPSDGGSVVLEVDREGRSVAVMRSASSVAVVQTDAAPRLRVGQRVLLRGGTARVLGRADHARFRATVLARSPGRLVVAAGGAVLSLKGAVRDDARRGGEIEVEVQFEDGELEVEHVAVVTPPVLGGAIEGHLTIGTGTITITPHASALVLKVPAGFDLSAFRNGDEVRATFTQGADGSLTVAKLVREDDEHEDEDEDDDHGGDRHGGDHDGGHGGHGHG